MVLLQLEDISHTYAGRDGRVQALNSVSLSVDAGEFVAIQGPSGCGKTTLLMIAGTLLEPGSGSVRVGETAPYSLTPDERARFRAGTIGFVFQTFHLVPYLSVLDNVLAPALSSEGDDLQDRAHQLIDRFGLTERASHVPSHLSSGERQRCALARALLKQPQLILADEPTGNLDEQNAEIVLSALRETSAEGTAVILVTHDKHAAESAGRHVRMEDGRIVEAIATAAT